MSGEEFTTNLADIIDCKWTLARSWLGTYELHFKGREDWRYVLQFDAPQYYYRMRGFMNLERGRTDSHTILQSLADQIVEGSLFSSLYILDCSTGGSQFLAACKQPLEAVLIEAELNFTRLREQDNGQQQTSRAS